MISFLAFTYFLKRRNRIKFWKNEIQNSTTEAERLLKVPIEEFDPTAFFKVFNSIINSKIGLQMEVSLKKDGYYFGPHPE